MAEDTRVKNASLVTAEVFAASLRHAMDKRGFKQADLIRMAADRGSKLGKSQVSQYVSGKTLPRRAVVQLLADILEIEPFELTGENRAAEYEATLAPATPMPAPATADGLSLIHI